MITSNGTTKRQPDTTQFAFSDEDMAEMLPWLVGSVDAFATRYEANEGEARQVFTHADDLIAVATSFINAEVTAADPTHETAYLMFLQSDHKGWEASASLLYLDLLLAHPELLVLLVKRLRAALRREWAAGGLSLQHLIPAERLDKIKTTLAAIDSTNADEVPNG